METTESWSNDNDRPSKRKRVALACEACRSRKVRCDGTKPICRPCEKRGETAAGCIYTVVAQTAKQLSEQEYVISLQRQIQDLNKIIIDLRSDATSAAVRNTAQQPVNPETSNERFEARPINSSPPNILEEYSNQPDASDLRSAAQAGTSPVSAMGATTIMPNIAIRSDEFYGQSSLHSLLQEVPRHAEQHKLRHARPANRQRQSPMLEAEYALPPRHVADQLLREYFENVHIFYPWTLSTSFQRRYESLWTSQGYPGNLTNERGDIGLGGDKCALSTFICALNAMFALGCEISNLPQKESTSAMFSSRMRALLHAEILDHGSLSHVQALLIVGHYLLTTDHPIRCYNVIGLACRMAVGAGMHSNRHAARRSVVENEIRRRVWYGCLQMEMTVCMTLGRPPLLQITDDVPLPVAVDDTHINVADDICVQPVGIPSQNMFMVENIKLAKILGNILSSVYCSDNRVPGNQVTANASSEFSVLIRLEGVLEQFKTSIPKILDWSQSTEDSGTVDAVLRRQRNVLHARFLHLRILLYRPTFSAFFASTRVSGHEDIQEAPLSTTVSGDDTLSTDFRHKCANVCLNNVFNLIDSLETAIKGDVTGAWWFSLLYLITCCGILILAECSQINHQHFDQQRLDSAWESCVTTLKLIGRTHFRAKGYLEHLCTLRKVARSACSSTTMTSRPPESSRRESMESMLSTNDLANWDPDFISNNIIGILDTDFMASSLFNDFEWRFGSGVQPTEGLPMNSNSL